MPELVVFAHFIHRGFGDFPSVFQIIQQFCLVFTAEDSFHLPCDAAVHAVTREGKVTHGDAFFVVLGDVFMQQLAVVAGGVEENGDGVFFVLGREDDHLVFQRFQFAEERRIAEVDRLAFVGQLHQTALQVVFAVLTGVEDALFGDDAAQAFHRAGADFHLFQAKIVQFFADDGVIRLCGGGKREQGKQDAFFHGLSCG